MDNSLYREEILDHYQHPYHFGAPATFDISSHKDNVFCGDHLSIYMCVHEGHIKSVYFDGGGCAISIASASILASYSEGKPIATLINLTTEEFLQLIHITPTPTRLKCALLSLEVLKSALIDKAKLG